MAEQWMGVPAAAAALGVDAANVRQQIAEEKLTVRTGDAGLEVLVTTLDAPAPAPSLTEVSNFPQPVGRAAVFEAMLASEADGEDDEHWPRAAPPASPRLGRYAPLPGSDVGTPIDPNARPFRSPLLAASPEAGAHRNGVTDNTTSTAPAGPRPFDAAGADELTRFQRLAGASIVLAQQRSDDAREQIAFARAESHRLRKAVRFAVAGAGVALTAGVLLATSYAVDASRAEGALQAHRDLVAQAEAEADKARDGMLVMKRENATLAERLANAEAQREAAKKELKQHESRFTQLEVEKRQAEVALQAALVSLYQHQPEAARTAIEQLRAEAE